MYASRIFQKRVPEVFFPISSKWGTLNFSKLQRDTYDDSEESNIKDSLNSTTKKNAIKNVNRKVKKSSTKSTKIQSFESENNSLHNIGQYKTHLKGTRSISYIVDDNAAKLMFKYIKEDLTPHDIILESHPGPGLLTKLLLKHTSNSIFAYEPKKFFKTELAKSIIDSERKRLSISELDLHKFYSYYIQAKKAPDLDRLSSLIDPLPVDTGKGDSHVKIATVVTDKKFFYRLNLSYAFQCGFYKTLSPINPVIYAYIPNKSLGILSGHTNNSTSNILSVPFHFYFTYDLLDKFPIRGFYPLYNRSSKKEKKEEDDYFHLIRIKPNPQIKDLIPVEEIDSFHYFLSRILRTKVQDTFIGQIEKFIPNCGPEFIKEGFRVFAHPRDFTQEQYVLAYKIFRSLPAYEDCMFHYYKRHWAMMFGEKDEDVLALKCDEESAIDLEEDDVEAEADIDVAENFNANVR